MMSFSPYPSHEAILELMLKRQYYHCKLKVKKQDVRQPELEFKVYSLSCRLKH